MRKLLLVLLLVVPLIQPVSALELEAPTVPDSALQFMPDEPENLGQALLELLRDGLLELSPNLKEASSVCLGLTAVVMLVSVSKSISEHQFRAIDLAGAVAIAALLLKSTHSMVNLAVVTVGEISEYGKLLLPVMTTAMAAQGKITTSTALYTGTAVFDAFLIGLIGKLLAPMLYFFLALSAATAAVGEEMLGKLRDQLKGTITWTLKTVMYVFTGYLGVTGVISGSADAAAVKAAKLTVSSVVPVVGGILSDASEAMLVTAGTVKNAIGVYGMLAVIAIWIGPFVKLAAHYLLLKTCGLVCGVFGSKSHCNLIQDFTAAMGLLLGMTGAMCLMLMVSMVCFVRGSA